MSSAQRITSWVLYPPAPARTGTWPFTSSTRISTVRTLSASVSVGLSPVVPHGTRKWMPASTCRRPRRLTARSSRSPDFVNGVTRAVPTPVKLVLVVLMAVPSRQHERPFACHPRRPAGRTSQAQHVLHRKPAGLALHPQRGGQRATGDG